MPMLPRSGGFAPRQGMGGLMKEGTKHASGVDEAVLKNIDACKSLSKIVRTSLGPNGMNKMIVNHLGKLFVTSDAATIVRELEVIHPAAKMVVQASEAQEREVGDGTGLVVAFAGELLEQAEKLLRMGLHTSEIVAGYETAAEHAISLLDSIVVHKVTDVHDEAAVTEALKPCIASKHFGVMDVLAPLISRACISALPANRNMFNVENVRVAKVLGGTISDSTVISGTVLTRGVEGTVTRVEAAKVAIFTCDLDTSASETKETVLLKSAAELTSYTKSEEAMMEKKIKALADAGVRVIASPKFGEVAMHFIDKYKIMAIKCPSKFDLRRVARTTKAVAHAKLVTPTRDELGDADLVEVREIGSTKCIVFTQRAQGSRISTLLVRASTQNLLDDVDRAVDDAVNVYKGMAEDGRFLAGAGGAEAELAFQLRTFARTRPGLDQYAIGKYADALEVVPRILAETSGCNATDVVSSLNAAHAEGRTAAGVRVEDGAIVDATESRVFDLLSVKKMALTLASDAVSTILRVDQIIMAKEAGGPKPRDMQAADM